MPNAQPRIADHLLPAEHEAMRAVDRLGLALDAAKAMLVPKLIGLTDPIQIARVVDEAHANVLDMVGGPARLLP